MLLFVSVNEQPSAFYFFSSRVFIYSKKIRKLFSLYKKADRFAAKSFAIGIIFSFYYY